MKNSVCLETRDLQFSYPDGPPVLQGISLTVESGDFVAIIGQNGSGKTTLVKHFNGLLRPTQGEVLLQGETIGDRGVSALAQHVGYVFQNPDHQIFSATVREELAFGPRNLGLDEASVASRVAAALARFNLESFADRQPAVLGFGLRRKVSIAAVVAMQTPILILDEPTAGLDLKSTTELMRLVGELNQQGYTIILITHDMRLVADYAPRCLVMRAGEVLAYGDTRAIFKQSDLLRETQISLPQICALGQRMSSYGLRDDILTVREFCADYRSALAARTSGEVQRAAHR